MYIWYIFLIYYIWMNKKCKRILRIRTLTQFIWFWTPFDVRATSLFIILSGPSIEQLQSVGLLSFRCRKRQIWQGDTKEEVVDCGGFVFPRWISTALFSAANVFYGLTPNGFKACTPLSPHSPGGRQIQEHAASCIRIRQTIWRLRSSTLEFATQCNS